MNMIINILIDFFNENKNKLLNLNRQQIINLLFNKLGMDITNIDENTEFIIKSKFDIYIKLKKQNINQIIDSINNMLIIDEFASKSKFIDLLWNHICDNFNKLKKSSFDSYLSSLLINYYKSKIGKKYLFVLIILVKNVNNFFIVISEDLLYHNKLE